MPEMLNELMTLEDGKLVIQHGSDGFRGKFVDEGVVLICTEKMQSLRSILIELEEKASAYLEDMAWSGEAGAEEFIE
jgi:hypothetical protein